MDENELDPTQGEPEGETVETPGDETPEPEQEAIAEPEATEEGEELEAVAEPEKVEEAPKPEKKKISWELRRINEETNKRRDAEKRLAELEARIAAQGKVPPKAETAEAEPVDIEQIRAQTRDQIRLEEAAKLQQQRFNEACNATFSNGKTEYGADFEHAVETMTNALGDKLISRPEFLETVTEMDNGHQVYFEMSRNPEEAERVLSLPTPKMILELAKMSLKVSKPAPKPISKAPAPVAPVGGSPKASNRLDDENADMDTWAKTYLKSIAGKG